MSAPTVATTASKIVAEARRPPPIRQTSRAKTRPTTPAITRCRENTDSNTVPTTPRSGKPGNSAPATIRNKIAVQIMAPTLSRRRTPARAFRDWEYSAADLVVIGRKKWFDYMYQDPRSRRFSGGVKTTGDRMGGSGLAALRFENSSRFLSLSAQERRHVEVIGGHVVDFLGDIASHLLHDIAHI